MTLEPRIQAADWQYERELLLGIRHEVFVREQGVPPELEENEYDPLALHFLVKDRVHGAIATARLLPDGQIGRMAVRKPFRHRGIGSSLLRHLIEIARKTGHRYVILNAQCSAEPFYRRFGFQAMGDVFNEAGIPHRRMHLRLSEKP